MQARSVAGRIRASHPFDPRRLQGPTVPIWVSGMRRSFIVPVRYKTVIAATMGSGYVTLRELSVRTGYSLSGLYHALASLKAMGILARWTATRGWMGRTILRWALDIRANVPPTVTATPPPRRFPRPVEGTLPPRPPEEVVPGGGWAALRAVMEGIGWTSRNDGGSSTR